MTLPRRIRQLQLVVLCKVFVVADETEVRRKSKGCHINLQGSGCTAYRRWKPTDGRDEV